MRLPEEAFFTGFISTTATALQGQPFLRLVTHHHYLVQIPALVVNVTVKLPKPALSLWLAAFLYKRKKVFHSPLQELKISRWCP
jgi:hypothetical protein